jgi:hypothetical protein
MFSGVIYIIIVFQVGVCKSLVHPVHQRAKCRLEALGPVLGHQLKSLVHPVHQRAKCRLEALDPVLGHQ